VSKFNIQIDFRSPNLPGGHLVHRHSF